MDIDQIQKEFRCVAHTDELKPNPHRYPIVDKWNYKYVIRPHKRELFKLISETIENNIEELVLKRLDKIADKDYFFKGD